MLPAISPKVLDVAIIGGGVAGAYAAYRIMNARPGDSPVLDRLREGKKHLDVGLFERSNRIGGRLKTHHFRTLSVPAELGGQAFSKISQSVYGLCEHLGLPLHPSAVYNTPPTFQYLRKHRFPFNAFKNPSEVPYFLNADERGLFPSEILLNALTKGLTQPKQRQAFTQHVKEITTALAKQDLSKALTLLNELYAMLQDATHKGLPIHEIGLWNLLQDEVSIEAYHLLSRATFSNAYFYNWSLYDAYLLILHELAFGLAKYFEITGGYDLLPKTLVKRFRENKGRLYKNHRLYKIETGFLDDNREPLLGLTFGDAGARNIHPSFFCARYVVLALPKRSLELMDPNSSFFITNQFLSDINTVSATPALKIFLAYDRPWWEEVPHLNIKIGNSFTDLPLRGCYYVGIDEQNNKALLLTSLTDGVAHEFWSGFHPFAALGNTASPFPIPIPRPTTGPLLLSVDQNATPNMVAEVQRQLTEMHGFDVPAPIDPPIFQDWTADPHGGGWHMWNPQVKSFEVIPRIRRLCVPVGPDQPEPRVFLCGEAYSAVQGWVEGAINTAEMVVEDYFGLKRPPWVDAAYEFGP